MHTDLPGKQEERTDIEIEHSVPTIGRILKRRSSPDPARVVDQNVNPSGLSNDRLGQGLRGTIGSKVGLKDKDVTAGCSDLSGGLLEIGKLARGNCYPCAGLSETGRNVTAYSAPTASDQRGLTREIEKLEATNVRSLNG